MINTSMEERILVKTGQVMDAVAQGFTLFFSISQMPFISEQHCKEPT